MDEKISLPTLPEAIWDTVLSYIDVNDLRNLLFVNRSIKQKIQPHLYHELTLTEWASSGARLARAIHQGAVSEETCQCIEKLRIQFTSIEEISEVLRLCLEIQPSMQSINSIDVEAHSTEDAMIAISLLAQTYVNCQSIRLVARAPCAQPLSLAYKVLPMVTALKIPRLFTHELPLLEKVLDLEIDEVCGTVWYPLTSHLPASAPSAPASTPAATSATVSSEAVPVLNHHSLGRLAVSYSTYKQLGSPPCIQLELMLNPTDTKVSVNDPACSVLKLATNYDLPQIIPELHTPTLRSLILCNIAPLPTIRLFELNNLATVEFLSVSPITLPAAQALAASTVLPALRILFVIVMTTSFLSETPVMRKRETRKLVEWLQTLASQYPVDVRDPSWLLQQDIYFSDGLWCLASQTPYREYLSLVAPPPLRAPQ